METKEKKVEFYGGAVGVWTPVIVMLIGMIINTVLAGGLTTLPMVTFLAMAVGFLLAKDKKTFGSVTLKGLQNPMFGTEAVAFIFAGILAQLLRQSGLIQALIYVVAQLELNTGLIPLIAFLTCMLISTACGTSLDSKTWSKRWLTKCENCLFAKLTKCLTKPYACSCLSFSCRSRIDGSYQYKFSIWVIFNPLHEIIG